MKVLLTRRALAILAILAGGGCDTEIVGLEYGDTISVRMDVTGGVAAADYGFELKDDGSIVGVHCVSACDFLPGDTLVRLTPAQRDAVKAVVEESGLPTAGRPADFGTPCCDQFTYRVIYTSGEVIRSFVGGAEALPEPLRKLVRTLHLAYLETPPLIVAATTGLEGFSLDPLNILAVRAVAGILEVDVTFGGGCVQHDLDAVAYTGWMESNPVQVGIAVTHDDRDDLCDALVEQTLRFDLDHLRIAYAEAYGAESGTLLLRLEGGSGAPGGEVLQVPYTW